jgi:hypothetical protein
VAVDYVWITLIIAVMGGMWWVAYRMEPHWSSRDGRRFMCTAQEIVDGEPVGHPRETRVVISPDRTLFVTQKRMLRRKSSVWHVIGKSPDPPRKLQVFVAQHRPDSLGPLSHLAIRIPTKSRCVPLLDDLVATPTAPTAPTAPEVRASRPAPRSAAPADPPAQD